MGVLTMTLIASRIDWESCSPSGSVRNLSFCSEHTSHAWFSTHSSFEECSVTEKDGWWKLEHRHTMSKSFLDRFRGEEKQVVPLSRPLNASSLDWQLRKLPFSQWIISWGFEMIRLDLMGGSETTIIDQQQIQGRQLGSELTDLLGSARSLLDVRRCSAIKNS